MKFKSTTPNTKITLANNDTLAKLIHRTHTLYSHIDIQPIVTVSHQKIIGVIFKTPHTNKALSIQANTHNEIFSTEHFSDMPHDFILHPIKCLEKQDRCVPQAYHLYRCYKAELSILVEQFAEGSL